MKPCASVVWKPLPALTPKASQHLLIEDLLSESSSLSPQNMKRSISYFEWWQFSDFHVKLLGLWALAGHLSLCQCVLWSSSLSGCNEDYHPPSSQSELNTEVSWRVRWLTEKGKLESRLERRVGRTDMEKQSSRSKIKEMIGDYFVCCKRIEKDLLPYGSHTTINRFHIISVCIKRLMNSFGLLAGQAVFICP